MKNNTKALAVIMLMTAVFFTEKCVNAQTYNGHDYVDLGLPSGTLWATCNVHANSLEQYGSFFAWGELYPKYIYTWGSYKHCKGDATQPQLTKYCDDPRSGYNGFTDYLFVLQPEDDAATIYWGADWSIPTDSQWLELCQNTTNKWTVQNGVNGWLFTARNGNSLFLPAAGYNADGYIMYVGKGGFYWSNSLDKNHADGACFLHFDKNGCVTDVNGGRYAGFSIRPVRSR